MYFLKAPSGEKTPIKPGILKVGRKQCDILLQSTASSRFHAEIVLNIKENYDIHNLEDISIEVNLKDHSKTGTFVNNTKIPTNEPASIKSGDKIIFGDPQYIYTLEYEPIIVTLSRMNKTEKQKVEKVIKSLGGYVCKNWDERCKYVIVNNDCELTLKVVWGCIYELPIITSEYFNQLLNGDKDIDIYKYMPTMEGNANIPDLHPMTCRRKTFENKTIIFLRQSQYEKMPSKCGGNEIKLYNMNKEEIKSFDWLKYSIGYIVIPSSNDLSDNENEYIEIIQSKNKNVYRMEETSIPTYIIYPNLPMPSQLTQQPQINNNNNEDICYTIPDTQVNKNDIEKQVSSIEFNEPKPLSKLKKKNNSKNNNSKRKREEEEIEKENNEPEKKRMKMNKLQQLYGNDNSSDIEDDNINNNNNNSSTRLSILQMDDDEEEDNNYSNESGYSSNSISKKRVDPFSLPLTNKKRKTKNTFIDDDFKQQQQSNNNNNIKEVRKKAIKITTNNANNSEESESTSLSLPSDKINEMHKIRKVTVNESDKQLSEDGNVNVIIMPMINMSIKPLGKQFIKKLKNNSVSKTKLTAYTLND